MNRLESFSKVNTKSRLQFSFTNLLDTGETLVNNIAATLITQGLTLTAVTPGAAGNNITVTFVDPGVLQAATTFTATGNAITITLRHDGSSITATDTNLVEDFEATPNGVDALVTITAEDTGDPITAAASANLAGGVSNLTLTCSNVTLAGVTDAIDIITNPSLISSVSGVVSIFATPDTANQVYQIDVQCFTSVGRQLTIRQYLCSYE